MAGSLADRVGRWCDSVGVESALRPSPAQLDRDFARCGETCRPGAEPARLRSWERRFGFALPSALKAWLQLSDGFYAGGGPLIHPLAAIGPMVPFTPIAGVAVLPESWFELGNPNWEPVCIDLAYRRAGGDCPLFTAGDGGRDGQPQVIAGGFASWFVALLHRAGAEFWLEPGFARLGDPWLDHRRLVPPPPLADGLRPHLSRVRDLLSRGRDEESIARDLGLARGEVEALIRHSQHSSEAFAPVGSRSGSGRSY